jgi:hypothetical protein
MEKRAQVWYLFVLQRQVFNIQYLSFVIVWFQYHESQYRTQMMNKHSSRTFNQRVLC